MGIEYRIMALDEKRRKELGYFLKQCRERLTPRAGEVTTACLAPGFDNLNMAAAYCNHTEVARLLVEAGANVNLVCDNGVAPLQHTRSRGFAEIAAILENSGAR